MEPLRNEQIQNLLSAELARQMKKGWEIIGVGPMGAVMGRNRSKHNGLVGGLALAPFSFGLSLLWILARNLDTKSEGLIINVSDFGEVSVRQVDYDEMMAELAVQQANS